MRATTSNEIFREPALFWNPDELHCAIQDTLAALADVDTFFHSELEALSEWGGPEHTKARIARELEEDHARDRAPYVRHLTLLESYLKSVLKAMH